MGYKSIRCKSSCLPTLLLASKLLTRGDSIPRINQFHVSAPEIANISRRQCETLRTRNRCNSPRRKTNRVTHGLRAGVHPAKNCSRPGVERRNSPLKQLHDFPRQSPLQLKPATAWRKRFDTCQQFSQIHRGEVGSFGTVDFWLICYLIRGLGSKAHRQVS